ncbi:ACT domain-containing protein [Aerococcus suis]|nr:ACT domain-containing protein [Aerococcus suis]
MKAFISVSGKDRVGILASVSTLCQQYNANILDVSQTILDDYFTMGMLVSIDQLSAPFSDFQDALQTKISDMQIHVMHEDSFTAMHRI